MSRILRLITIARTAFKYRLDTLFEDADRPWLLRLLVSISARLPKPKDTRAVRLRQSLEDLGPIFVKFGQLLSTRPDLVPADICLELNKLQDNVPPFSVDEFTGIVETAFNTTVDELFLKFDKQPLASASVAQVHTALLNDGREVVVKVIRPGIERVIEQDTSLLITLARWIENVSPLGKRLHLLEIANDYRLTIFDELDLKREAANTSTLRRNFKGSRLLYVPEVHWSHTNQKVMTTERIYATPVTNLDVLSGQQVDFKVLAERGVEIFFTQVFDHNFFHADMHPGNIFVDHRNPASPSYMAVDCAIIGTLSDDDRYYLARNLIAIFRRDYRQVAELHVLSGWIPERTPIGEFEAAIRTVCEPIFERPLREISFAQILVNLFHTAQRFEMEVQPSLVLLQKTLINIEGLGRQLYPDLDLWATAHPFLEKWLKERFRPKALVDRLERHGPEWLEQFPKVPQLLYESLERIRNLEHRAAPAPKKTRRRTASRWLGAALLGIGFGLGATQWATAIADLPTLSLVMAATGFLLLLLR